MDPESAPGVARDHVAERSPLEGCEPPVRGGMAAIEVVELPIVTEVSVNIDEPVNAAPGVSDLPSSAVAAAPVDRAPGGCRHVAAFGDAGGALRGLVEVCSLSLCVPFYCAGRLY